MQNYQFIKTDPKVILCTAWKIERQKSARLDFDSVTTILFWLFLITSSNPTIQTLAFSYSVFLILRLVFSLVAGMNRTLTEMRVQANKINNAI
jgi:hypothetical protein